MLPGVAIVLKDNPSVPTVVDRPEYPNFLSNHAIGTKPTKRKELVSRYHKKTSLSLQRLEVHLPKNGRLLVGFRSELSEPSTSNQFFKPHPNPKEQFLPWSKAMTATPIPTYRGLVPGIALWFLKSGSSQASKDNPLALQPEQRSLGWTAPWW